MIMITETPIFDALVDERPDVYGHMIRKPWSYAAALKAADEAIAARAEKPRAKRPAKTAAARKGAS